MRPITIKKALVIATGVLLASSVVLADDHLTEAVALTRDEFGVIGVMLLLSIVANVYQARVIERKDRQMLELHGEFQQLSEKFLRMLSRALRHFERSGAPAIELDDLVGGDNGGA